MNSLAEVPDQDQWTAWRPAELARRLRGVARPWCVVGGWALDLWHGAETRAHGDLEFTVLRDDLGVFRRALGGLEFYTAHDGVLEHLAMDREPTADVFQVWCLDGSAGRWRADMMIEPGTDADWVCKRDAAVRRPRAEMVMLTADGIPYLNPSAVLLFKAKYRRPKDEADFEGALPKLARPERLWLRDCLALLHPGHDWIEALRDPVRRDPPGGPGGPQP